MSRSCWLSAVSRSITSRSIGWVQRFTPLFADAARPLRHAVGDRWFVDETYVKVAGRWRYLYRAVDQYGQVIDVLLAEHRDTTAARRFFTRALRYGPAPVQVTTDKAGLPGRRRSSSPWPAASCRATALSNSRSASVCAEPMCSMSRDPRCCECTICTARAPDAVLTVRTCATTRQPRITRLVRASQHESAGHRATAR